MNLTRQSDQNNWITHMITVWVVCLHVIFHLVTINIFVTGWIRIGETKVEIKDLQNWYLSEFFVLIAVLSLMFVIITVLSSGQGQRNRFIWIEKGLQVALSFGTFIYTMVLNHIYPLMSFGEI